jgi:hypothetical protein
MVADIKCPNPERQCLIDPIDLTDRMARMETKLDQIIKDQDEAKKNVSTGMSGKTVAGWSILNTGLLVGLYEGLRAYLASRGIHFGQ